jgi:signal peptidase I
MMNASTVKPRQKAGGNLWLVFGLIIAILFLVFYFYTPMCVSGHSMSPTLRDGQLLFLQHAPSFFDSSYQRGEIVVLSPPKELQLRASRYVKRIIAVPGDLLSIRNGIVYLNFQALAEPYVMQHSSLPENFPEVVISKGEVVAFEGFALGELPEYLKDTFGMLEPLPRDILEQSEEGNVTYVGTIKLAKDFYFVLGDNRGFSASEDSRLFGAIPARRILGAAHTF